MTKAQALLRGPENGSWLHVDGGSSASLRCSICDRPTATAWRWFVGPVAHITVCEACTDEALREENPR